MVIANEVHDMAEADDTDHVEFDLGEFKEHLGIDSILEKLNDLAAKFWRWILEIPFPVRKGSNNLRICSGSGRNRIVI